jgi:hypothetical protein
LCITVKCFWLARKSKQRVWVVGGWCGWLGGGA